MGELWVRVTYTHIIGDRLDAVSNAAQNPSFLLFISCARCGKAALRLVFMAMRHKCLHVSLVLDEQR
jgi:hypothetical protein